MNALALSLFAALSWMDLEPSQGVQLTEKVTLGEPSFPAGTRLLLEEKEGLGIPVVRYKLREAECAHPEWESEMAIITPRGNEESSAVGVQLSRGCAWEVFVEQKDLLTPSLFTSSPDGDNP